MIPSEKVKPILSIVKFTELDGVYIRPKMKLCFAIKMIRFAWVIIANKMKCNFVSGKVGVKRPIKNVNKAERDIEPCML